MSGLELNKLCAAVLLAGVIAMTTGFLADGLYRPNKHIEKRGFEVEVAEEASHGGAVADAGPVDIANFMAAASATEGENVSKACVSCHTFDKGGADKTGPNLWGIVGRDPASHSSFAYSPAMQEHKGKHKWGYQELSEFLTNPKQYVKGTRMSYAGISKPEKRAHLLAYLRTLSDSPAPLPVAKPAAEPAKEDAPAPKDGDKKDDAKKDDKKK